MQPSPIPPPNTVTLAVWLLYRHLRGHTHSVYDKYCQPTLTKPAAPSRAQSLSGQTRLHTQVMPGPGLGSSLTIPALPPAPRQRVPFPDRLLAWSRICMCSEHTPAGTSASVWTSAEAPSRPGCPSGLPYPTLACGMN